MAPLRVALEDGTKEGSRSVLLGEWYGEKGTAAEGTVIETGDGAADCGIADAGSPQGNLRVVAASEELMSDDVHELSLPGREDRGEGG
jgi:hypothetical protein